MMTFGTEAHVTNIKMNGVSYYNNVQTNSYRMDKGLGDSFAVIGDPNVITTDFVLETDVTLLDGPSAALAFGIKDPNKPAAKWFGANFNFNDNNARIFNVGDGYGVSEGNATGGLADVIQRDKAIHMKLEVTLEGVATLTLNNVGENETFVASTQLSGYTGGYLGLLTWESGAKFDNTTIALGDSYELFNTTHFNDIGGHGISVDKVNDTVTINNNNGDHFVMNALTGRTTDFFYEADVVFPNYSAGSLSAGLVFGTNSKTNPGQSWFAANTDTSGNELFRIFYVPGPVNHVVVRPNEVDVDYSKPVHFAIDVKNNGDFVYKFGNLDGNMYERTGNINGWAGGYAGLLTFNEKAVFSNIHFINRNKKVEIKENVLENDGSFKTNLTDLFTTNAFKDDWSITSEGLVSDNVGGGDTFFFTKTSAKNFVYETDVTFKSDEGAAALIFRSNNDLTNTNKECYAVNFDIGNGKGKMWRWYRNGDIQLSDQVSVPATADKTYHLKVVAYNSWLSYYVNDTLVANLGDYNANRYGQNTYINEGYFGMLNWNGEVVFQNTYFKEFTDEFTPLATNIKVTPTGDEKTAIFTSTEPTMLQYVDYDVDKVNFDVTTASSDAVVSVKYNGTTYPNGKDVPVKLGKNVIEVAVTDTLDGTSATVTYKVDVHRLDKDELYYNEAYRGQYHYSVREGWANDPNGMVYFNGKYHFFYQFWDDVVHGPMHWAHATSTDLIHWEEEPIAFYPDANGTMFSGCAVIDEENTSGLFEGSEGGIVALITEDGNGQRVKVAYSTDGYNWTKVDKIAADWSDDPLGDGAFRDPKVFRWENKWFMVIAGGPLRIYSSDNLLEWECESTYSWLHTECPDLYPIEANDGNVKWVLSRGGRGYKVGDFKEVDGNWTFVPDTAYANNKDGIMNFGEDSYAAMTYYVNDFGTAANPTLPELIEINWMNTWADGFCNSVGNTVGQKFNGTFNLNLSLGLVHDGEKYVLTQTPIEKTTSGLVHGGYEELRGEPVVDTDGYVEVEADNTLLKDVLSDTYEIVANFKPGTASKVGFSLREGNGQKVVVLYDVNTKELSIDRSQSSSIYTSGFYTKKMSQIVSENADGSIDMHIFVDKSSVEVFMEGHTVAGAAQIFADPTSLGASLIVEGGKAEADVTVYNLDSIWTDKAELTEPTSVESTSKATQNVGVGKDIELSAYVMPITVSQDIEWALVSGEEYASLEVVDGKAKVTGLAIGNAVVRATAKGTNVSKDFTIKVHNFQTNIDEWTNAGGDWTIEGETLSDANVSRNDYYMSTEKLDVTDFVLETDLAFDKGLINLFVASPDHGNGQAYAVQFADWGMVRLFYFAGDTIKEVSIDDYNENGFFHATVEKSGKTLRIYVEDKLAIEHTFDEVASYYANPSYVGLGLWDGDVSVQNFFVYDTSMVTEHYPIFESLVEDEYTTESYKAYKDAYDEAKAGITALNIAELVEKLNDAKDGLVNVVSLNKVINEVKDTDTSKYTDASVKAFKDALTNAKEALVDGTAKEVDDAEKALVEAYNALEEKPEGETGGSGEGTPEGSDTGDTTNVGFLMMLLLASMGVLLRKRKEA